jgi:hypothetical protein
MFEGFKNPIIAFLLGVTVGGALIRLSLYLGYLN